MKKALLAIIIIIIGLIIITTAIATMLIISYSFEQDQPKKADDTLSSQEGIQEVINANNEFAFDIYSKLDSSKRVNIVYSPYSISAALGVTYEGAQGQTADEIQSVFHFPERDILRQNFAAIYNNINTRDSTYELKTGNALWVQDDFLLLKNYTTIIEQYYGGKAANVDYINEPENSRKTINSFIEKQTNNKIKNLIPSGTINPMTRLIITNAIYFKGTWEWEFDKSDTRDMEFKITPTEIIKVPIMYMEPKKAQFNYADLGNLQIIELPYKGEAISMIIILPNQRDDYDIETEEIITSNYTLEDIELSSEKFNEYKSHMTKTTVGAIYLPKFKFDTKYSMKDTLSALGMPTAFDPNTADFSGMTGNKDLFIDEVIHQAYITVDEKGTEAAAATAISMMMTSAAMPRNIFRADHPFIFIIQERKTGNILFMGKVINPT